MESETKALKVIDKRMELTPAEKETIDAESTNAVVLMALQKNYSPEFIEKLMDLADRAEKTNARRDFFQAFADFKKIAPPVKKDKYNKYFNSWYTSLGGLLDTYNPVLGECGLSVSFPTPEQGNDKITVICRLSHRSGHCEDHKITGPIDKAAIGKVSGQRSRNAIQDIKSTLTYYRSATCEMALGVSGTEASVDDDGNAIGKIEYVSKGQVVAMQKIIDEKGLDTDLFFTYVSESIVNSEVKKLEEIPKKDFKEVMIVLKKAKKVEREPGQEG